MRKTFIGRNGYLKFKRSGKPVHRWVAEKILGRKLGSSEVVHHKDRNKLNNSKSNLWVFSSQKAHNAIHDQDKKRFGPRASYKGFDN